MRLPCPRSSMPSLLYAFTSLGISAVLCSVVRTRFKVSFRTLLWSDKPRLALDLQGTM